MPSLDPNRLEFTSHFAKRNSFTHLNLKYNISCILKQADGWVSDHFKVIKRGTKGVIVRKVKIEACFQTWCDLTYLIFYIFQIILDCK